MGETAFILIIQPGLTLAPGVATVVKLVETRHGERQRRECLSDLLLQPGGLLTGQPRVLCVALRDIVQHLLQHLGGNYAHILAPLLPECVQVMMETLGFRPLGAVKTHDFIVRQNELQLAPHQPAFTVDSQKLIKRNKVFVAFPGDFHPGIKENHPVVRVLRQAFA